MTAFDTPKTATLQPPEAFIFPAQVRDVTYTIVEPATPGLPVLTDLKKAKDLLAELHTDVGAWYCKMFGVQKFDTFSLGASRLDVQERFWSDPRFADALKLLQIDPALTRKIGLPWWNELLLSGADGTVNGDNASVEFTPIHSYHQQLLRAGALGDRQRSTSTVSGLLITKPTPDAPNGECLLGLRGGLSFPNTWHIIAGSITYNDSVPHQGSITTLFERFELPEETGLKKDQISNLHPFGQFHDRKLSRDDLNYLFTVNLSLTAQEFLAHWQAGTHVDKAEHKNFLVIKNDPESIREALTLFYKGKSENLIGRLDLQREILHPGAIALALHAGISLQELEGIAAKAERVTASQRKYPIEITDKASCEIDPGTIAHVLFDIDGTLILRGGPPSEAVRRSIPELQDTGRTVGCASGRAPYLAAPLVTELGIKGPSVFLAGACVVDESLNVLASWPIAEPTVEALIGDLHSLGMPFEIVTAKAMYAENTSHENIRIHQSFFPEHGIVEVTDVLAKSKEEEVLMVSIVISKEQFSQKIGELRARFPELVFNDGANHDEMCFVNVTRRDATPRTALHWLEKHAGFSANKTMCFGDTQSDEVLMGQVAWPIAMGNAHESTKQKAKYITKTVADDGVAFALKVLELI